MHIRRKAAAFCIASITFLVAFPVTHPIASAQALEPTIDPTNRNSVWDAYHTWADTYVGTFINWNGSTTDCRPGTSTTTSRKAVVDGININRKAAGLPVVTEDTALNALTQRGALVAQANNGTTTITQCANKWDDALGAAAIEPFGFASFPGVTSVISQFSGRDVGTKGPQQRANLLDPTLSTVGVGYSSSMSATLAGGSAVGRQTASGPELITWPNAGFTMPHLARPSNTTTRFSVTGSTDLDFSSINLTVTSRGDQLAVSTKGIVNNGTSKTAWFDVVDKYTSDIERKYDATVRGIKSNGKTIEHSWSTTYLSGREAPTPFVDIDKKTQFLTEISWLADTKISTGWGVEYGQREFRPLHPIARDAMAAFLYRMSGSPAYTPPTESPFIDVPTTSQFYKEITWLADRGITTGWDVGNGKKEFRPLESVNRDAMAAFLYRLSGKPDFDQPNNPMFVDVQEDSQFYTEITWLAIEGVSTGWDIDDKQREYRPVTPVARNAMAAFLYRISSR